MEYQIEHFFDYLNYESLDKHDINFHKPTKNDRGVFIAKLHTPMAFYLPKSELFDMYQDPFSNNIVNYIINLDLHPEMITFLENLDTLCVSTATENSKEWFNKDLDIETLIKYYNTLYDMSEDETDIYLPVEIENTDDISNIMTYNEDSGAIISIKIVGIEFYKQTFKWKLEFNSISQIDDIATDSCDSEDSESSEEEIDFNSIFIKDTCVNDNSIQSDEQVLQSSERVEQPERIEQSKEIKKPDEEERRIGAKQFNVALSESDEDNTVVNESMINELAEPLISKKEVLESIENPVDSLDNYETNNQIDISDNINDDMITNNKAISEIQSIIQDKRIQARKFSLNANRAKRASDTLSFKANEIHKEIALYENKLKAHATT